MKLFFSNTCVICGREMVSVTKDHIVPFYKGGSDSIRNIQPACKSCNSSKSGDITDYRPLFCKIKGLILPDYWKLKPGKISRAEKAGRKLAESIVEITQMLYQNNTKKNFLKGVVDIISEARNEN